jgi:serine/threonine protein kinase
MLEEKSSSAYRSHSLTDCFVNWQPLVSTSGRDLISLILEPDPQKRITMEQVVSHPWFQQELPPGALEMNESFLKTSAGKDPSKDSQVRLTSHRTPSPSPQPTIYVCVY